MEECEIEEEGYAKAQRAQNALDEAVHTCCWAIAL